MTEYKFPVYRYQATDKYYILLLPRLNRAEVGVVQRPELVNDFMLWMGFKTVKIFTATTSRKAYNKAKEWIKRGVLE
jgi:hypothetical protein